VTRGNDVGRVLARAARLAPRHAGGRRRHAPRADARGARSGAGPAARPARPL